MKRARLLKHLRRHSCEILREGKSHTIVVKLNTGMQSSLPRHSEIKPATVKAICKQLDVPVPSER